MKQLIQYFKSGKLELIEAPVPNASSTSLVNETFVSLISVGTEKMLLNFGKASFLNKAKQQPEKVQQVLDKIKTEGVISTMEAVWSKLNEPTPIGYSNVGIVTEKGDSVEEFNIGDRVVSNGSHAEFVKVPWTLTAKIPDNVDDSSAAFTIVGAIAIEGIRLLRPNIGDRVVVIGLGLLGQLTSQILEANGCEVIGFDIDNLKIKIAQKMGLTAFTSKSVKETINLALGSTNGIGADGVIITASSPSEEILSQAALMSRKRGKIVLVGVVPISVPRNLFYEKELSFQVSSAYGPGRYDPKYEEKGIDYPFPYVRWTAKRNMEAFLYLLSKEKIQVKELITHRFKFSNAFEAYACIDTENPLGILLEYKIEKYNKSKSTILESVPDKTREISEIEVGFLGTGNFAKMVLLPALKKTNANIRIISSSDGYSAAISGRKVEAMQATSTKDEIFKDAEINTIFIATRHSSHAFLVQKAIEAKKHVFVEKPLAISLNELKQVYDAVQKEKSIKLMVGFNRRFSPFSVKLRELLIERSDPISIIITVNAGSIPIKHWVHDPEVGGGRIIGEGCHFVDLARFLVGHPILSVVATATSGHSQTDGDKVMSLLNFKDGSQAAFHYLANGNKKYPKERIEVFSSERVFVIDNFKTLTSYGQKYRLRKFKQDKGHQEEIFQFIESVKGNKLPPISTKEIFEIHLATFAIITSIERKTIISMTDMWNSLINVVDE